MFKVLAAATAMIALATASGAKPKKVAKHGDWEVLCERKTGECTAQQKLRTPDQETVEISGFPVQSGEAVAGFEIRVSGNALLKPGITISIDGGQWLAYDYTVCRKSRCLIQLGLTSKTLKEYLRGQTGEIHFYLFDDPHVRRTARFSLSGFSDAFADVGNRSGPRRVTGQ
ncbi:invasion associated locus B family protein [Leisingera sp. ANG-M1]|uniref:invasion associated locus B family protein n=1 Tax=Leisingera sp. ANG-M1 TaxID=1577895 RepID=UPI00068F1A73|nr:invasion associated locus B family protein [Leisingera sp. ANG-M1]